MCIMKGTSGSKISLCIICILSQVTHDGEGGLVETEKNYIEVLTCHSTNMHMAKHVLYICTLSVMSLIASGQMEVTLL